MGVHTYLGPKDLQGPWQDDRQNCTHESQNGKIVHTHLRIAPCEYTLWFAHVVCDSCGPMCISYIPFMVHWAMHPACTGGLNIVLVGPKT